MTGRMCESMEGLVLNEFFQAREVIPQQSACLACQVMGSIYSTAVYIYNADHMSQIYT